MVTIGLEEEYSFLDPETLQPVAVSNAVYRELRVARAESRNIQREFLLSQLERPTPVCATAAEASADLRGFRHRLFDAAERCGVIAASTGTYPVTSGPAEVTPKERYLRVTREYPSLAVRHYYNGLHIHVAIPDREAGVLALNGLRPWMPVLVALGANSPIWHGTDSGFASWRTINLQRWATRGTPSVMADAADYERRVRSIVGVGGTFDRALVAWNMRLSDHFPTIEVRGPDAQLHAWQSVFLAAVVRGLVTTILAEHADDAAARNHLFSPELVDSALWHAARDGLTGDLVSPFTGVLVPAREVTASMLGHIEAALREEGDTALVAAGLDRLHDGDTGASAQSAAYDSGGIPALAALLRTSLIEE